MYIDTHVHLTDKLFKDDLSEVLKRASDQAIQKMIVIAYDVQSSIDVVKLARQYPNLYCAVGIHPCDASQWSENTRLILEDLLNEREKNKIVAIGEIGLDYHYPDVPKEPQYQCFMEQIILAKKYDLPIIIHDRDAHEDCYKVVNEAYQKNLLLKEAGVFHCFSSSAEMAKRLAKFGFYFGFDGPLTYKNAKQPVEACQSIPLDRLLIETDCPYLPPVPHRGKRNEPSFVVKVAEKMAEIKNVDLQEIATITTENALRLFKGLNN